MKKVVAALLRFFPAKFRDEFGGDLLVTFEDRWRERAGLRLALTTVFDLTRSAILEHLTHPAISPEARKGDSSMTIFWQDFRFAARTLLKNGAFTLVALATLALGIGVNTAMFSIANAVLWRSLPYPHPERLVSVADVDAQNPATVWGASYPNFRDWQARVSSFEKLAAILRDERTLREGPELVRVEGAAVTYDFFDVMAVPPVMGRVFTAAEDKPGTAPVVVFSHHMWMQKFAGDPAILGRSIHFEDAAPTVIGVMPATFDYRQAQFFTPLEQVIPRQFTTRRSVWVLAAVGRLKPGASAFGPAKIQWARASRLDRLNSTRGSPLWASSRTSVRSDSIPTSATPLMSPWHSSPGPASTWPFDPPASPRPSSRPSAESCIGSNPRC